MAVLQSSFGEDLQVGYPGMEADGELSNIITRTLETGTVGFGKAVYQGTNDRGAVTTPSANLLGFTIAKPNRPGNRKIRNNGQSWNISGSGEDNVDIEATYSTAFGIKKQYDVELYKDDDTDGGELLGTYSGTAMMTTRNQSFATGGDTGGGAEITLEGEGELVWAAAGAA
ncbi:structural cement protein Gp24 [Croceibacterium ferulae]|uniref:structural cement protein Gp24 n=1 Tax=Croceibacterium ferulae TaxID=1854641 RepID=UPI000F881389|nr:hypothetical protein [Croceibacterium ferulae]